MSVVAHSVPSPFCAFSRIVGVGGNFSVESFNLSVCLGVIKGCTQVLSSQVRSHGYNELRYELQSFIGQYVR